jgi:hypothetical protein
MMSFADKTKFLMLYTGCYITFIGTFLNYLSLCTSYDYNLIKGHLNTQLFIDNIQHVSTIRGYRQGSHVKVTKQIT